MIDPMVDRVIVLCTWTFLTFCAGLWVGYRNGKAAARPVCDYCGRPPKGWLWKKDIAKVCPDCLASQAREDK